MNNERENGRKIGILGGMFDPVHIGHLCSAIAVQETLGLDEVRLLPCARPPHRTAAMAADHDRLSMLEAAIADMEGLRVDDRECRRDDISYTYDTMVSLRQEFPQDRLCFILGSDAFSQFDGWYRWRELLDLCHWALVPRPGWQLQLQGELSALMETRCCRQAGHFMAQGAGHIWQAPASLLQLSSSQVRELLAQGRSLRFLLPEAVIAYIDEHKLYHS